MASVKVAAAAADVNPACVLAMETINLLPGAIMSCTQAGQLSKGVPLGRLTVERVVEVPPVPKRLKVKVPPGLLAAPLSKKFN